MARAKAFPASAGQCAGSHSIIDSIASSGSVCAARYCLVQTSIWARENSLPGRPVVRQSGLRRYPRPWRAAHRAEHCVVDGAALLDGYFGQTPDSRRCGRLRSSSRRNMLPMTSAVLAKVIGTGDRDRCSAQRRQHAKNSRSTAMRGLEQCAGEVDASAHSYRFAPSGEEKRRIGLSAGKFLDGQRTLKSGHVRRQVAREIVDVELKAGIHDGLPQRGGGFI